MNGRFYFYLGSPPVTRFGAIVRLDDGYSSPRVIIGFHPKPRLLIIDPLFILVVRVLQYVESPLLYRQQRLISFRK